MLGLVSGRKHAAALLALAAAAPAAAADQAMLDLGRQVFTSRSEPRCAICHTLAAAEAAGELGPNLDEARPSEEKVRAAVVGGFEAMPPYAEKLTQDEIDAVAAYVAAVAGRAE